LACINPAWLTVLPHTQVMVVTSWPITSAVSVSTMNSPVLEATLWY
jgi:hypothetical protein